MATEDTRAGCPLKQRLLSRLSALGVYFTEGRWLTYLPALGICVTAGLLLFVSECLLGKVEVQENDFDKFQVRSPEEKKAADEKGQVKDKARTKIVILGTRTPVELGTIKEIIDRFKDRSEKLDVQTRKLSFLTTWSVVNILQGALAIVVLALSGRILWRYRPCKDPDVPKKKSKANLWIALFLIVSSVVLIVVADQTGLAPLSVQKSVNGVLQKEARKALGLTSEIGVLTNVGNVSIVLVIVFAPLSLCLLLYSSLYREQQFRDFQQLMYWTAFLLVVGVIQVTYQNRMPALFFDDEFNVQQIGQMASGTGLLVGSVLSVAMGLVFLPAGFILGERFPAGGAVQDNRGMGWFTEIVAVLAPVLTALPIGKLFDIVG